MGLPPYTLPAQGRPARRESAGTKGMRKDLKASTKPRVACKVPGCACRAREPIMKMLECERARTRDRGGGGTVQL